MQLHKALILTQLPIRRYWVRISLAKGRKQIALERRFLNVDPNIHSLSIFVVAIFNAQYLKPTILK